MPRRHQDDERTYRGLESHKERVQSFNAASMKLVEYARVQIEMDATPARAAAEIVNRRIETLQRVIDRLRRLA